MPVESKKPQIQSKSKRSAAIFGALDHQRVIQLVKICSFAKTCFLLFGPVSRPTSFTQDCYYNIIYATQATNEQMQETDKYKKQTRKRKNKPNATYAKNVEAWSRRCFLGHVSLFCQCFLGHEN